jgi:hypothetical protein
MNQRMFRKDVIGRQDLALGELCKVTDFDRKFILDEILVSVSIEITETITITRRSKYGPEYDFVLDKKNLISERNYSYSPKVNNNFADGDNIELKCTNANGVGIISYNIRTSVI